MARQALMVLAHLRCGHTYAQLATGFGISLNTVYRYSGKHKKHGMNVQVLADHSGRLLWASPALPGAVHDLRAAREHGILDSLAEAGIRRDAGHVASNCPRTPSDHQQVR
jgi:DNA-binding CsgD family transcriptional regulator